MLAPGRTTFLDATGVFAGRSARAAAELASGAQISGALGSCPWWSNRDRDGVPCNDG